ncbi:hypothetical protein A3A64_02840 [Candidatus Gottesmanbacteria bacterium RIFCSPLOWO2_01_FULL_48_11]|nr:MAG: Lysine-tRNA ligase [Candidatus Yanofskybacteria bacterium GW2011_GWA1_48_10]OGG27548.1 MAG: hypothetical protein A3A64_02840 [Candidatus Gottesmanbacteria bacterium RIFCSPLOWO2_01_FULL_48_11]
MKLSVEPKIFETFTGVDIGVVVIDSMDNRGHSEEILGLLRAEEARQKELLTGVELGSLPEISAWREIYRKFGSDPHDFRSSIESLLRRARGGSKPLPQINNLVDLYNFLSLKYHLPVGAEDMDKATGDIILGFSDGTEKGVSLGSDTEEVCYAGEVIYKDTKGFLCRRWNWREADRTKIEEASKRAIMVIEKAAAVPDSTLASALDEAKQLIGQYLGATCRVHILDVNNQEVML